MVDFTANIARNFSPFLLRMDDFVDLLVLRELFGGRRELFIGA